MSMKLSRDGFLTAAQAKSEAFDSLLNMFVGLIDRKPEDTEINGIKHMDTKTILAMSDDQRMELYNKIINQVMDTEHNESA